MKTVGICLITLLTWASVCFSQTLEIEPNNRTNQATVITSGVQLQGSLFGRNDKDYYVLTLTEQQEVTLPVTTSIRDLFREMTLEVSIFDTNQSKVGGFTSEVSTEVNTKLIAGPGSVYVRVAVASTSSRLGVLDNRRKGM